MTGTSRDRGITLPIVAMVLPVLILMTAFAIDLGRQRSSRRTMQARADIVSLDLIRLADGRTEAQILADSSYVAYLQQTADRNEVDLAQLTIEWGTWNGTNSIACRLSTDPPSTTCVPDAVEVTAQETTDYFFRPGSGDVERSAVATAAPLVDLTVGSIAAGLQPNFPAPAVDQDLENQRLNRQVEALNQRLARAFNPVNPGVGLDLIGYQGIAAADVELERVAANAGFGSADEMMDSEMTAGQFFDATATALDQQAHEQDPPEPATFAAAARYRQFERDAQVDRSRRMRLRNVFEGEIGGDDAQASTRVNALDFLNAGAQAIDGSAALQYGITHGIPNVTSVNVSQYTIKPITIAPKRRLGDSASNTQVRFQIDVQANLPVPTLLGTVLQPINIPLVVEAAVAVGTVDFLECSTPDSSSLADIDVDTSAVRVTLGTAADLGATNLVINQAVLIPPGQVTEKFLARIGILDLLEFNVNGAMTGTAAATFLGTSDTILTFEPNDPPVEFQRAQGGAGANSIATSFEASFAAFLEGEPLGLDPLGVNRSRTLARELSPTLNLIQQNVIEPLLAASGASLAGADVKAENLRCDSVRLVG